MKKKLSGFIVLSALMCMLFSMTVMAADIIVSGGSTMAGATNLSFGKDYAAHIENDNALYFKFTTPAKRGYLDLYQKNLSVNDGWNRYLSFQYMTGLEEELHSFRCPKGNEQSKNVQLEPNTTYYIKVYIEGAVNDPRSGNFRLNIKYTEDKEGDTAAEAVSMNLSKIKYGTTDGTADVDYYKFKTGKWSQYTFYVQNITIATDGYWDEFCGVIESTLQEEVKRGGARRQGKNEYVVELEPYTTYYIRAYASNGQKGQYGLKVTPVKTDISPILASYKQTCTYTGKALKPSVKVTLNGKTLKKGTDYKLTYSSNKNPGVAKIKVTGINDYKGSVTLKFDIKPKQQKITYLKSTKKGKMTVKVKKDTKASGYQVCYSKKANFKDAKKVNIKKATSKTFSATRGKKYYVKIRSYKKVGSRTIYGSWSKTKTVRIK